MTGQVNKLPTRQMQHISDTMRLPHSFAMHLEGESSCVTDAIGDKTAKSLDDLFSLSALMRPRGAISKSEVCPVSCAGSALHHSIPTVSSWAVLSYHVQI